MNVNQKYRKFIKDVNWANGKTHKDSSDLKLYIMNKYSKEFLKEVEEFGRGLASRLYEAVEEYQNRYDYLEVGSDDGFCDLRAHVASMGEEAVERAVKNPKLLQSRYRRGDYQENFFYIFPYEDDYKMFEIDYYLESTKRIRKEIGQPIDMDQQEVLEICDEIDNGVFNPEYSYDYLSNLSKAADIMGEVGYTLPNIHKDGLTFYGKNIVDLV